MPPAPVGCSDRRRRRCCCCAERPQGSSAGLACALAPALDTGASVKQGRIGSFVVDGPMVIGHESAGEVAAVGAGVAGLAPGDRVALEPGVPCCASRHFREGRYNLAPIRFHATPPVHGSLAEVRG